MNHETALGLATAAAAALVDVEPQAIVTTDPDEALNAVAGGSSAVLIQPPRLTFPTYHQVEAAFTVYVVPGAGDRDRAWTSADELLRRLREAWDDVTEAAPYDWRPDADTAPLVAYEVTVNTHHDT